MRFVFLFLGKTREKYLDAGIKDYAVRLGRFVPVDLVILKEKHARNQADEVVKQHDAELLLERCRDASMTIALDPAGKQIDSMGLARMVTDWEARGQQRIYFLIGGHLGLQQRVVEEADHVLSLSRLTFTHEMTRLILLEQLYRACSIKAGRSYHK